MAITAVDKRQISVLVVDDSSVMRHIVKNTLEDLEFKVVGVAVNGKDAVFKNEALNPDVIIMDLIMGEFDGIYGVREIMQSEHPKPIILLSSVGNTDMSPVFEALDAGAFDYVNKPQKHQSKIGDVSETLKTKIESAYNSNLSVLKKSALTQKQHNSNHHTFDASLPYDIILIGSSTGGPTAVEKVIRTLPGNLPVPVVITQHMPENFILPFVKRLNNINGLPVKLLVGEEEIKPGNIYVVPGGRNSVMAESGGRVTLKATRKKFKAYNAPSIDSVFLSAVKIFQEKTIGVILTGMGKDGAMGLKEIKNAGGLTIAQNEASCVVYGMPKEAVNQGAVDYSLDVKEISGFVISSIS